MAKPDKHNAQATAGAMAETSLIMTNNSLGHSPHHLWTPPMPPVTKTWMPARAASNMVADTVVAPCARAASTAGKSRRDTFATDVPARAMSSSCSREHPACVHVHCAGMCVWNAGRSAKCRHWQMYAPMHGRPSMMAMVAGTAPWLRTMPSTSSAVRRLCG